MLILFCKFTNVYSNAKNKVVKKVLKRKKNVTFALRNKSNNYKQYE